MKEVAVATCANVIGFPGKARAQLRISCDQVAAAHLGKDTRYQSLQLNCPKSDTGNGHGGVAISYREDGSPLTVCFDSPLEVYQRLFVCLFPRKKSSIPSNNERAYLTSSNSRAVPPNEWSIGMTGIDLEEYATSIRDIELTISREEEWLNVPYPKATMKAPNDSQVLARMVLKVMKAIRTMQQLILAAWITDSNVVTYRMPDAGLLKSMDISSRLTHFLITEAMPPS